MIDQHELEGTEQQIREIIRETETDEDLKTVIHYITAGWPETKQEVAEVARIYFQFRDELTYQDRIIFKG